VEELPGGFYLELHRPSVQSIWPLFAPLRMLMRTLGLVRAQPVVDDCSQGVAGEFRPPGT